MLDVIKGLRILGDIETTKGQLYERFCEMFASQGETAQLFGRLALDQVAHRNVIQYQTRIVMRNPRVFRRLRIDFLELQGICAAMESFRESCPAPSVDQALQASLDFESLSLSLFDQEFFRGLSVHFRPFVENIQGGIRKHLDLLRRAATRRSAPLPFRPEPLQPAGQPALPIDAAGALEDAEAPPLAAGADPPAVAHRAERELLLMLFDALDESVFMLDGDRRVIYWNAAAQDLGRSTGEELVGSHCWNDHLIQRDGEACATCSHPCLLGVAMLSGTPQTGELYFQHKSGSRVPMTVSVHPLRNGRSEVTGAVEIFKERVGVHGTHETMAQLEKLAFLDSLTGLANRRYLEVTLLTRLQELQRYGWRFGIIFIDVDNLKVVNDTFGHAAGDLIIRAVGRAFADHARLSDMVGCWGGDEFMAIVTGVDPGQLAAAGEKFRALVEEEVIQDGLRPLRATISVGATPAVPEDTIDTLVSRGDQLMFHSKRMGKNRVTGPREAAEDGGTEIRV
jgi:diguanylate cyclase (GGDEF)-like protein/PAS domain S-box-containing protein